MPLKLIVLLRLVRLVNLSLTHFVQFCMPRLFFLIEWFGCCRNRCVRWLLLGNTVKID